ncbi:MAG: rRNA maturation RNase YbeY [Proteobacteria bacterium]|nr:rRNA maturation RNase YbeY [Pseudomonadota bacterium]
MDTPGDIGQPRQPEGSRDSEPPPRLHLDVIVEGGDWPAEGDLEKSLARIAMVIGADPDLAKDFAEPATACVAFSSDEHVAQLNGQFRNKPKPTNVLSFPAPEQPKAMNSSPRNLGDIVLAASVVAREAEAQSKPLEHHMQHLVVHGVLHLLGFDHEETGEAEIMERLETSILARLGVPDPYADGE